MRSGIRGSLMISSLPGSLPPATSTASAAKGRSQPTPTAPGPYCAHWGVVGNGVAQDELCGVVASGRELKCDG